MKQLKSFELNADRTKEFAALCEIINVNPVRVGSCVNERGYKKICFRLSQPINLNFLWARQYINKGTSHEQRKNRAAILYGLYSSHNLILDGHPFPSKRMWNQLHPGMTLDHKMPKSRFPEVALDPDNWQPLTKGQNVDKGSKVFVKDALSYVDKEAYVAKKRIERLYF